MTKSKTRWYNSTLAAGIIAAIVGGIIPIVGDVWKGLPILTTMKAWISFVQSWFHIIWNFQLHLGWTVVSVLIIIFAGLLMIKFALKSKEAPEFTNYKSSVFKKWRWSWEWKYNGQNWVISSLCPHCPQCDTPLHINNAPLSKPTAKCPRCTYSIHRNSREDEIEWADETETLIIDTIQRQQKDENLK